MPRIISFDELVAMPKGTLYWEYEPEIFTGMSVFVRPITHEGNQGPSDFWLISLVPWKAFDRVRSGELLFADSIERWGAFDFDQLFCVLDDDDMDLLKSRINGETD